MVFFVCDCGANATRFKDVASVRLCIVCGSSFKECDSLPLSFFNRRKSFFELSSEDLCVQESKVLDAIKVLQPCSDREVACYLNIERSSVNGRRNRLMNASIPFIIEMGSKIDVKTNKTVTLWGINNGKEKVN